MPERSGPPAGRLAISVIGLPGVSAGGRELEIKSRKAKALLAYLALTDRHEETRGRLVGLLWSESDEEKARGSLRQSLREIRRALRAVGVDAVRIEKGSVGLLPDRIEVDLAPVLRDAERGVPNRRLLDVPRLPEAILTDCDGLDPAFGQWLLETREAVSGRIQSALERRIDESGSVAAALLAMTPGHEPACRAVMRDLAGRGDSAGAQRAYLTLRDFLQRDLDAKPSAATTELAAEIKRGAFEKLSGSDDEGATPIRLPRPAEPKDGRAGAIGRPLLVLEPFALNGDFHDKLHLIAGFHHHLVASLVCFREWSIVSSVPPPSGAEGALAVYQVRGTAYQTGDVLNLILTLHDHARESCLWSQRVVIRLERWFETQHQVVGKLAALLNVQVSSERSRRLAATPIVSVPVLDRWLRGQHLIQRFDQESWQDAIALFTSTIRDAPAFSPGYSGMAQMRNGSHFVHPGTFREPGQTRQALDLARKAVELDPADSRAQLSLAWAYAFLGRHAEAEEHGDLARRLNDHDAWTLISAAGLHGFAGNPERAAELAREATRLSPCPTALHWAYEAFIAFLREDYEGAVAAAGKSSKAVEIVSAWHAAALFHLGRVEEARSEVAGFVDRIKVRWSGSLPPDHRNIGKWVLHAHPIRRRLDQERLRTGLRGSGMPVA